MNATKTNNRDMPSTSNENQWIIEHPNISNDDDGANGLDASMSNEGEPSYFIADGGDNDDDMMEATVVTGDDEESLEEVSAEPIFSNPNSEDEDDGAELEQSRDHDELEEEEEEEV